MWNFLLQHCPSAFTRGLPLLATRPIGTEAGTAAAPNGWAAVPIPLSTGWVEPFLLAIVWLFVAAAVLGPLLSFFRLEPRSPQPFVDDPKLRR